MAWHRQHVSATLVVQADHAASAANIRDLWRPVLSLRRRTHRIGFASRELFSNRQRPLLPRPESDLAARTLVDSRPHTLDLRARRAPRVRIRQARAGVQTTANRRRRNRKSPQRRTAIRCLTNTSIDQITLARAAVGVRPLGEQFRRGAGLSRMARHRSSARVARTQRLPRVPRPGRSPAGHQRACRRDR